MTWGTSSSYGQGLETMSPPMSPTARPMTGISTVSTASHDSEVGPIQREWYATGHRQGSVQGQRDDVPVDQPQPTANQATGTGRTPGYGQPNPYQNQGYGGTATYYQPATASSASTPQRGLTQPWTVWDSTENRNRTFQAFHQQWYELVAGQWVTTSLDPNNSNRFWPRD
jgi:hypothetical protein